MPGEAKPIPMRQGLIEFQELLLAACEGKVRNTDKDDNHTYHQFREAFVKDVRVSDTVPDFVRRHRDADGLWAFLKRHAPDYATRRSYIREQMEPMFDREEGITDPPAPPQPRPPVRTQRQRLLIIRELAPVALMGTERLIEELSHSLHNGGPVDDDVASALHGLRTLHAALGALLASVDGPKEDVGEGLERLAAAKAAALRWSADNFKLIAGTLPLTGYTTVLGAGVWALVAAITKNPDAAATFSAGVMASAGFSGITAKKQGRTGARPSLSLPIIQQHNSASPSQATRRTDALWL